MEQRIGFGKRLGALVLDCIIVWILAWVGAGTIGGMLGGATAAAVSGMTPGDSTAAAMAMVGGVLGTVFAMAIAFIVIAAVYFLIEGFTGYTLGKLILGIRIANADGTAASVTTLLGRYLVKNCNYVLSFVGLITGMHVLITLGRLGGLIIFVGCFFTLGTAKQAFHDMLMKTAVYPKGVIKA